MRAYPGSDRVTKSPEWRMAKRSPIGKTQKGDGRGFLFFFPFCCWQQQQQHRHNNTVRPMDARRVSTTIPTGQVTVSKKKKKPDRQKKKKKKKKGKGKRERGTQANRVIMAAAAAAPYIPIGW